MKKGLGEVPGLARTGVVSGEASAHRALAFKRNKGYCRVVHHKAGRSAQPRAVSPQLRLERNWAEKVTRACNSCPYIHGLLSARHTESKTQHLLSLSKTKGAFNNVEGKRACFIEKEASNATRRTYFLSFGLATPIWNRIKLPLFLWLMLQSNPLCPISVHKVE